MLRLMTPVKARYLLTSITRPIRELKCAAHRGQVFFFKLTADQLLVFDWIAGSCHVKLLKTGQDRPFRNSAGNWGEFHFLTNR